MQDFWLSLTAAGMVGAGAVLIWRNRPRPAQHQSTGAHLPSPYSTNRKDPIGPAISPHQIAIGNRMAVLAFDDIVAHTGTESLIRSIRDKSGATSSAFNLSWLSTLRETAEFVQLLPASESHHHANPGGLWQHMLESVDFALNLRRGMILPAGAQPEDVMRLEHRWTFGVFLGALLHDIGRPIADLRITRYEDLTAAGKPWQPLAGSLKAFEATHYSVDFTNPNERNYEAHKRLGAILMQRFVPPTTLHWLSEEPTLIGVLNQYLSGEGETGPIPELCKQADQESVRRNLMFGPRTRFSSARSVPLIERLMEALRRQLADNSLPLNRAGAMGFVGPDSVWFIAKPVADAVRDYLIKNESGAGVPGEEKNDRLFDTWQEYGAITVNPATNGAIWTVRLVSDQLPESMTNGQTFTMLRFPLEKLYPSPSHYPRPFPGTIEPVVRGQTVPRGDTPAETKPDSKPERTPTPIIRQLKACTGPVAAGKEQAEIRASQSPASCTATSAPIVVNATGESVNAQPGIEPADDDPFADSISTPNSDPIEPVQAVDTADTGPIQGVTTPPPQANANAPIAHHSAPIPMPTKRTGPIQQLNNGQDAEEWLDEDEGAGPVKTESHKSSASDNAKPTKAGPATGGNVKPLTINKKAKTAQLPEPPKPVPGSTGNLPKLPGSSRKEPTQAALDFMKWIQQGICDNTLPYNDSAALIHFVPEGMLLVSPAIFRFYAEKFGEPPRRSQKHEDGPAETPIASRLGLSIQRDVIDAGWHLQLPKKNNINRYQVVARGKPGKMLSGVLIQRPENWFNPVPPHNPILVKVKSEFFTSLGGA